MQFAFFHRHPSLTKATRLWLASPHRVMHCGGQRTLSFLFVFLLMVSGIISGRFLDEPNGTCPLDVFLPFGTTKPPLIHHPMTTFSHIAAVVLAMNHFNNRDTSVVPELGNEEYTNCTITFPIEDTIVHDTETNGQLAATCLLQEIQRRDRYPCGIVGPWYSNTAIQLSIVASGLDIPLVTHGAETAVLSRSQDVFHPLTTRTCVNSHALGDAIMDYLNHINRTNFLGIIADISDHAFNFVQTFERSSMALGVTHITAHHFAPPQSEPYPGYAGPGSLTYSFSALKNSTYKTMFAVVNTDAKFQVLADEAEKYEMNGDDYVWFLFGESLDMMDALLEKAATNKNLSKLIQGGGTVRQIDGFAWNKNDRFLQNWKLQGKDIVDQINLINPIDPLRTEGGKLFPISYRAPDDYFQQELPRHGAGFAYDAAMMIGMGACLAKKAEAEAEPEPPKKGKGASRGPPPTVGRRHYDAMLTAEFTGATGKLRWREKRRYKNRLRQHLYYGAYNFRSVSPAPDDSEKRNMRVVLTEVYVNENFGERWTSVDGEAFIFSNGSSVGPLLRDIPDANYLSQSVRALGLSLMSLTIVLCILFMGFVVRHRETNIIRTNQPIFLMILCCGSIVSILTILTLSFDESYGISSRGLAVLCQISPWLFVLGYIAVYAALFCKLWRVQKVLSFRKRRVKVSHVFLPFVVLLVLSIVILALWTGLDPWTWKREFIDFETGETFGQCQSANAIYFFLPLLLVMAAATIMAFSMAWNMQDVHENFAESKYIFYTIYAQMQATVVMIPVLMVLNKVSADAVYLGRISLVWTFSVTSVMFLIFPKVISHYGVFRRKKSNRDRILEVVAGPSSTQISGVGPGGARSRGRPRPAEPCSKNSRRTTSTSNATQSQPDSNHPATQQANETHRIELEDLQDLDSVLNRQTETISEVDQVNGLALDPTRNDLATDQINYGTEVDPSNEGLTIDTLDNILALDPIDNNLAVDPVDNSLAVDPVDNSLAVDPVDKSLAVDPIDNSLAVDPLEDTDVEPKEVIEAVQVDPMLCQSVSEVDPFEHMHVDLFADSEII